MMHLNFVFSEFKMASQLSCGIEHTCHKLMIQNILQQIVFLLHTFKILANDLTLSIFTLQLLMSGLNLTNGKEDTHDVLPLVYFTTYTTYPENPHHIIVLLILCVISRAAM